MEIRVPQVNDLRHHIRFISQVFLDLRCHLHVFSMADGTNDVQSIWLYQFSTTFGSKNKDNSLTGWSARVALGDEEHIIWSSFSFPIETHFHQTQERILVEGSHSNKFSQILTKSSQIKTAHLASIQIQGPKTRKVKSLIGLETDKTAE